MGILYFKFYIAWNHAGTRLFQASSEQKTDLISTQLILWTKREVSQIEDPQLFWENFLPLLTLPTPSLSSSFLPEFLPIFLSAYPAHYIYLTKFSSSYTSQHCFTLQLPIFYQRTLNNLADSASSHSSRHLYWVLMVWTLPLNSTTSLPSSVHRQRISDVNFQN